MIKEITEKDYMDAKKDKSQTFKIPTDNTVTCKPIMIPCFASGAHIYCYQSISALPRYFRTDTRGNMRALLTFLCVGRTSGIPLEEFITCQNRAQILDLL